MWSVQNINRNQIMLQRCEFIAHYNYFQGKVFSAAAYVVIGHKGIIPYHHHHKNSIRKFYNDSKSAEEHMYADDLLLQICWGQDEVR